MVLNWLQFVYFTFDFSFDFSFSSLDPYLHNDLHLREGPPGWPGGNEAWRAQEPINAHSHLISMLLGEQWK
jgi:hypothetical protein